MISRVVNMINENYEGVIGSMMRNMPLMLWYFTFSMHLLSSLFCHKNWLYRFFHLTALVLRSVNTFANLPVMHQMTLMSSIFLKICTFCLYFFSFTHYCASYHLSVLLLSFWQNPIVLFLACIHQRKKNVDNEGVNNCLGISICSNVRNAYRFSWNWKIMNFVLLDDSCWI